MGFVSSLYVSQTFLYRERQNVETGIGTGGEGRKKDEVGITEDGQRQETYKAGFMPRP